MEKRIYVLGLPTPVAQLAGARGSSLVNDYSLGYGSSNPPQRQGGTCLQNRRRSRAASNAIKFTHRGSVTIQVEKHHRTYSEVRLRISVRDTGIGIPEEHSDRLFDKFTQLDTSAARKYGGTGLGLAISKRLAELMGGSVGFTSRVGDGSTFWYDVTLRIDSAPPPAEGRDGRSLTRHGQAVAFPKAVTGRRILVAEDNTVNQRLLVRCLQRLGCQVDVASNGIEALEKWRRSVYDFVLMDCQMPEMDGYEVTAQIRSPEHGQSHTPIVAITAHAMIGDRERCKRAGMDDYLTKPIDFDQLARVIAASFASLAPRL